MDFNKYKKPKNLPVTINLVASSILLSYDLVHSIVLKDVTISFESQIPYLILLFVALLSLFLIDFSEDKDQKHDELKTVINKQDPYVPFAKEVMGSDFEISNMARKAKKSIFVVGPNLNFIANEENGDIKKFLYEKMDKNKDLKILMLLSNPDCKEICNAMSRYTFTENFVDELNTAIPNLINWKKVVEEKGIKSQLFIRKTSMVTLSLLFIDGEEPNGCALITPIPVNVPGRARPCFLIEKRQHEEAFNKYYNAYRDLFNSKTKSKDIEWLWQDVS